MWIKTEDNEYVRKVSVTAITIEKGKTSDKNKEGHPFGITFRTVNAEYTAPIPKEYGLKFMEDVLERVLNDLENKEGLIDVQKIVEEEKGKTA